MKKNFFFYIIRIYVEVAAAVLIKHHKLKPYPIIQAQPPIVLRPASSAHRQDHTDRYNKKETQYQDHWSTQAVTQAPGAINTIDVCVYSSEVL